MTLLGRVTNLSNGIDYFLCHTDHGQNHSGIFPMSQSWAELVNRSNDLQDVETGLIENKGKLVYFLQIYPQRVSTKTIEVLDTF